MKHLKIFENYDETGQLLLYYGDEPPTTWFYIEDAIIDGLLDEKWQLDDNIIEDIGNTCFYEDMLTQGDLALMIEQDFEATLQRIFEYLIENDIINEEVNVSIEGVDEEGEEWNLSYI